MKARIATFNPRGRGTIWWEYVKKIRYIFEEELNWSEFERLFWKKYLSKRYYDDREKDIYDPKMGSMTDE